MDKANLSSLLSEIKTKTGHSEARLSVLIGVSQPTVNRILNGQAECNSKTYRAIVALHDETVLVQSERDAA